MALTRRIPPLTGDAQGTPQFLPPELVQGLAYSNKARSTQNHYDFACGRALLVHCAQSR